VLNSRFLVAKFTLSEAEWAPRNDIAFKLRYSRSILIEETDEPAQFL